MHSYGKIRSLTNEVIRRMVTTSELVSDTDRCETLDRLAQKLFNSGYNIK